jgi:hypothetical protein
MYDAMTVKLSCANNSDPAWDSPGPSIYRKPLHASNSKQLIPQSINLSGRHPPSLAAMPLPTNHPSTYHSIAHPLAEQD